MTNAELSKNYETMEQADVERLSTIDRIIYSLHWVIKCQSSPTRHHERNQNGCLGCINTIKAMTEELKSLQDKLKDAALDFAKKHDEEMNALKNRMVERP